MDEERMGEWVGDETHGWMEGWMSGEFEKMEWRGGRGMFEGWMDGRVNELMKGEVDEWKKKG